jgi:hypothetical protein
MDSDCACVASAVMTDVGRHLAASVGERPLGSLLLVELELPFRLCFFVEDSLFSSEDNPGMGLSMEECDDF